MYSYGSRGGGSSYGGTGYGGYSCKAVWDKAVGLAKMRNRIAHSPIAMTWKNRAEEGESDVIALTDYRTLHRRGPESD